MTQITIREIARFQTQLTDYPEALEALQEIEDCDGDLEDAAISLAIKVGLQPDIANSEWLPGLAKKCRAVICQSEIRNDLINENLAQIVTHLMTAKICPKLLIVPVLMYVFQQGVNEFCAPLDPII